MIRKIAATFTRANDAAAYAGFEVVGSPDSSLLFFSPNAVDVPGAGAKVVGGSIQYSPATVPSDFRLHLYGGLIPDQADNGQFQHLFDNRDKYLGPLLFTPFGDEGISANTVCLTTYDTLAFACNPYSSAVYGLLESVNGFVPQPGQNFYVELMLDLS